MDIIEQGYAAQESVNTQAEFETSGEISAKEIIDALISHYDIAPIKAARLLTDFVNDYIKLSKTKEQQK